MTRSLLTQLILLPAALRVYSLPQTASTRLEARLADSNDTVAPLSFAPDGLWGGIDGSWSSFAIEAGTPPQSLRVFISWASYQTWVVLPQGCAAATDVSACTTARGGIFDLKSSSTWDRIGYYYLGVEDTLGYTGSGLFGYDTIALGAPSAGMPTVKNTTVGGLAVNDYYLGIFGMNPQSTNFSSLDASSPSYISLLKEQGHIPSESFGYTAGALYRDSGIFASLTLGGYDPSKIIENSLEFEFNYGVSTKSGTALALKSISTESQVTSSAVPTELLSSPIYVTLDATVPQFWLPVAVCAVFEQEFGLTYDNTTHLYLVNDTQHTALLQRNANITFQMAASTKSDQTVSITLPYAAFDLTALPPYQGLTVNTTYFPLRRATDPSQYTFGRAFFQEAYISVDFERQTFNVSAVNWNSTSSGKLVAIAPYSDPSPFSTAGEATLSDGLSKGELAGIVTGSLAGFALIGIFVAWLFHPHGHKPLPQDEPKVALDAPLQEKKSLLAHKARLTKPMPGKQMAQKVTATPKADAAPRALHQPIIVKIPGHDAAQSASTSGDSSAARSPVRSRRGSFVPPASGSSSPGGRNRRGSQTLRSNTAHILEQHEQRKRSSGSATPVPPMPPAPQRHSHPQGSARVAVPIGQDAVKTPSIAPPHNRPPILNDLAPAISEIHVQTRSTAPSRLRLSSEDYVATSTSEPLMKSPSMASPRARRASHSQIPTPISEDAVVPPAEPSAPPRPLSYVDMYRSRHRTVSDGISRITTPTSGASTPLLGMAPKNRVVDRAQARSQVHWAEMEETSAEAIDRTPRAVREEEGDERAATTAPPATMAATTTGPVVHAAFSFEYDSPGAGGQARQ